MLYTVYKFIFIIYIYIYIDMNKKCNITQTFQTVITNINVCKYIIVIKKKTYIIVLSFVHLHHEMLKLLISMKSHNFCDSFQEREKPTSTNQGSE